jgi:hypothetical protein
MMIELINIIETIILFMNHLFIKKIGYLNQIIILFNRYHASKIII